MIKYYPSCTKFEELSQTDEWKLYLHFYGNACRDFKQRYRQALEFALDEHQHPFVLKKPFKNNIGRKIFFPMNAGVPFIIHPNGITHTPPKDFSTKERNNFLMSGTLASDLCPHKYW